MKREDEKWRITIEAVGPDWHGLLPAILRLAAEAVAAGPFIGTQTKECETCVAHLTGEDLRERDDRDACGD